MERYHVMRNRPVKGIIAMAALLLFNHQVSSGENKSDNYPRHYTATASKLMVRSKPARTSAVVDVILKGHRIDITVPSGTAETIDGMKGEWLKAKTMKGTEGYVFSAYLKQARPEPDFKDSTFFPGHRSCAGDWADCLRNIEAKLLKQHPAKAAREKDDLVFTHVSKAKTILTDTKA